MFLAYPEIEKDEIIMDPEIQTRLLDFERISAEKYEQHDYKKQGETERSSLGWRTWIYYRNRQASHHYTSESASAGMHVRRLPGKVNLTGNASRGSMRSDFDSVTSQSGIHAGSDGYEIMVKENTRIKGELIDRMRDTYNFDWHMVNQSSYKNEHIKLIMNNGAVLYQEIGALQPFNWTASVKGRVQGERKK